MDSADVARAIGVTIAIAVGLGMEADDAIVLQNSNRLAIRLRPCDVVARVAFIGRRVAAFEVELARRLTDVGCPSGGADPRVEPRAYERDGYSVTFWTYYEPVTAQIPPADYAAALARLHSGMRKIDVPAPHFTDRVASAEAIVTSRDLAPELAETEREMLTSTLRQVRQRIRERGASEQLLHGEPHQGNVLGTANGPVFVDLETCCRGPVEFDLAHVPEAVSQQYPSVDHSLLRDCRQLVLAMVAAWRWELGDQLPNGKRAGRELLSVLRAGARWPTLDELFDRVDGP